MPEIVSSAVELVVYRFMHDHPEVLLLRRSMDEQVYPGLWQIVTGKLRAGEKAPDGALRELREETGTDPLYLWNVPYVNSFYEPVQDRIHLIPFFAAQIPPEAQVRLSAEHCEYRWMEFGEADLLIPWPGQRKGLEIVLREIVGGRGAGELTRIPFS